MKTMVLNDMYALANNGFLYLDGSNTLRLPFKKDCAHLEKILSLKYFKKNPDSFFESSQALYQQYREENQLFYMKLFALYQNYIINHVITLNPFLDENNSEFITSFFGRYNESYCEICGKRLEKRAEANLKCCGALCRPTTLLWNEDINLKDYFEASKMVSNSETIIIDNSFLSFEVTRNLVNRISDKSKVIILTTQDFEQYDMGDVMYLKTDPTEFILSL